MSKKKEKNQTNPIPAQTAGDVQAVKKKSHAGVYAILMIAAGIAAFVAGLYFYRLTWGTRLLFTRASLGRISKYWMIFAGAGLLLVLIGSLILKFRKKPAAEEAAAPEIPDADQNLYMEVPGADQNMYTEASATAQNIPAEPQNGERTEIGEICPAEPVSQTPSVPESAGEAAVTAKPEEKVPPAAGNTETAEAAKMTPQVTPTVRFCLNCGTPNKPNSKFCRNCGSRL